jgi:hypothetical protein
LLFLFNLEGGWMVAVGRLGMAGQYIAVLADLPDCEDDLRKFLIEDSKEGESQVAELVVLGNSNKFDVWIG